MLVARQILGTSPFLFLPFLRMYSCGIHHHAAYQRIIRMLQPFAGIVALDEQHRTKWPDSLRQLNPNLSLPNTGTILPSSIPVSPPSSAMV
ncbi:hypothetical protein EDC04DRAFT_2772971 [Pisolithus marmoratus]|nr:hypothetical protein EDC04DRAFT_2772971 [Pisolithus marmoratus]